VNAEEAKYLAKARRMLLQAQNLDAQEAPESVVHLCYYAMFHAATAVLLRHRATVALTHTGLVGTFGRLAKDLGESARQYGRALNRAADIRLRADYGIAYDDLAESALTLRDEAQAFVAFCESLLME
jgi:uncharacterized protein (UPF0332 family)